MPKWALYGVIATVALGIALGVINYIQRRERTVVEAEQVKESLGAIAERFKNNEEIKNLDLPGLCRELDGVWANDQCN